MRDFLVNINPNIELPKYELVLTKMNEEPITTLKNIENFEIKSYFANVSEISFEVPLYRTEQNGRQVKNEIYDLVDGSTMVLINDNQYFILTKPTITSNKQTGETVKSVIGFSREYELAQKKVIGYEGTSRSLYDYANTKDENGLEIGILNYLERVTSWRVGYINADLLNKYRTLSFPKTTLLQALQEVQKTFGCLFKYDTINKIIDVYDISQLGSDKGLNISDRNFINKNTQEINHDEIKTRLYLYGKDNISIQSINISGKPYVENFDFYKNTKYMSQGLIDALNNYEELVQTREGEYSDLLDDLHSLNESLTLSLIEMQTLESELKLIESNIDVAIVDGQPTATLVQDKKNKEQEIITKQDSIDNLDSQIDTKYIEISQLQNSIDINNTLTDEQLKELDPFIREDDFTDANYTEDNIEELFDKGKEILSKISYPKLQFNVDVEDFLSLVEGQHVWDKFILGDLVTLSDEDLDVDYKFRLVGYTHNPDNNKLNLIFSNQDSVDDDSVYLSELLESITTTSSTVDYSRYRWDKGEEAKSTIDKYVDSALDLSKQAILKAEGQRPIIDDRGLWLYKETTNEQGQPIIDDKQIRAINNIIAFTNDNWNTVSTAITGNGVVAESIFGKLGAFAKVQANQIVVGDDGEVLSDDVLGGSILKQDVPYNGVMINSQSGIQVTTNNNLIKSTFNATEGILIESRPDVNSAWSRNFYVDSAGKIQANNIEIDGSGKFTGEIQATSGTFKGRIEANDGFFKGDITGASGTFAGVVNASDYRIGGVSILSNNKIHGNYLTNVVADSVNANWVYTGGLTANQIISSGVKVGAGGIQLDPSATISWNNITSKPSIPTLPSYIQSTKITSTSIESPTITAATLTGATIYGGEYYGLHSNSAYLKMGTVVGNSNLADLSIFRGKSTGQTLPVFRVYDQVTRVDLQIGTGYSTPKTILGSTGDDTYLYSNWNFNNATVTGLTISFA